MDKKGCKGEARLASLLPIFPMMKRWGRPPKHGYAVYLRHAQGDNEANRAKKETKDQVPLLPKQWIVHSICLLETLHHKVDLLVHHFLGH